MNITVDNNNLVITLSSSEISGVNISALSDYNYASIYAKISDSQYFSCSCDWKKYSDIPDFVVALMGLIKQSKETASTSGAWEGKEAEFQECMKIVSDKKGE
jgi:hypothetical protein